MLKTFVPFTIQSREGERGFSCFFYFIVVKRWWQSKFPPRQCYVLFSDDKVAFRQPGCAAIVGLLLFFSLRNDFSRHFFFLVGIRSTGVSNVHSLTKLRAWHFTESNSLIIDWLVSCQGRDKLRRRHVLKESKC